HQVGQPSGQHREQEVTEALREFQVTSSYLRVDNGKINRGQTFWIAEKQNGWARIVCLETKNSPAPLVGWVSLVELSQRSTWRGEIPAATYPPPAPVVMYPPVRYEPTVIIIDDDDWHWRRRRPGHHWPHRRRW
ncbi:MAG TPA: hypothetical protein PKO06_22675, partial [Candidatus Ozemobacteraceae bacterium]|nr:hypothetical protein [Candidatus Ozemobacteraceae bacterium]